MRILTHKTNTPESFRRSLRAGYGAELDVRDAAGALVVSHDLPAARCAGLERFLAEYAAAGGDLPLALNIKACGLQAKLAALLAKFKVRNYFVFDMAVPDGLGYLKRSLRVFTRQSEYEPAPAYYDQAAGVWLDEFHGPWIGLAAVRGHLAAGKQVCVVSPELHKRDYAEEWGKLRAIEKKTGRDSLMLCTDHPRRARLYFNGRD
ncbi:MAG: hypothetical protein A2089_07040 [Elusimicrobia bacterium GWD2_63_28]|nr:MAG: hypothetical protein A2089_07040 [Elusimicrobia bacterium GWD2_63_28]